MKTLGIIGGLGPQATAYFMRLLTEMNEADEDKQHFPSIAISNPAVPDRTDYILGKSSQSPLPYIIDIGKKLVEYGADFIAIPCITAHYFHKEMEENIPGTIIDGIRETVLHAKEAEVKSAAILATDGTIQSKIFQKAFESEGMKVLLPDNRQQKIVMDVIYRGVKAGKPIPIEEFRQVCNSFLGEKSQIVVLGCTELSLIKRDYELPCGCLDAMEVLSRASVLRCGKLKTQYESLI